MTTNTINFKNKTDNIERPRRGTLTISKSQVSGDEEKWQYFNTIYKNCSEGKITEEEEFHLFADFWEYPYDEFMKLYKELEILQTVLSNCFATVIEESGEIELLKLFDKYEKDKIYTGYKVLSWEPDYGEPLNSIFLSCSILSRFDEWIIAYNYLKPHQKELVHSLYENKEEIEKTDMKKRTNSQGAYVYQIWKRF